MLGAGCTRARDRLKRMMGGRNQGHGAGLAAPPRRSRAPKVIWRDGLFDDLDAALARHPAPFAGRPRASCGAQQDQGAVYGRTAHSGNSPGRPQRLKGAEMFGIGAQMMREHMLPSGRVHYIYEAAGVAPNVVPDFAEVWLVARDADRPRSTP